jgi:hypothetical protein
MTITFTDSATEHAERKSTTTTTTTTNIDRSEFTHEVPVQMPDMGEGKGKIN